MEQWETDLNNTYSKYERNVKIPFDRVKRIVRDIVKKERKRDKLQELIDYVHKSKSNTDILINYIYNNTMPCDGYEPSEELMNELGIKYTDKEAVILCILERHIIAPQYEINLDIVMDNPPKETGT